MITREQVRSEEGTSFPAKSFQKNILEPIFNVQKKYYYQIFIEITKAHVVMLHEQKIISNEEVKLIMEGIQEVEKIHFEEYAYDPAVEDLFFMIERELEQTIGSDLAGRVHIARSRNDICIAEFRLALREKAVGLIETVNGLREALLVLIEENFETVMPAYTHTQPAQPTTLSHYLLSMYDAITRDYERLLRAEKAINRSPLGAAAITTTGFPISRQRVSDLLGFDELIENSYDSIGGADYLMELAAAVMILATDCSKIMKDILDLCTVEFGGIRLQDAYVQTSSIMPQKRNPSSLEHCRPILGKAIGEANVVFTVLHNTPYGDIVDSEEDLQPHLYDAIKYCENAMEVMKNAFLTMTINKDHLRKRAIEGFITVTELADTLVRDEGLSFRLAHHLTSRIVKTLYHQGLNVEDLDEELVRTLSIEVVGRELRLTDEDLRLALNPVHFVEIRDRIGGPAKRETERMYKERMAAYQEQKKTTEQIRGKYQDAHLALTAEVDRIINRG